MSQMTSPSVFYKSSNSSQGSRFLVGSTDSAKRSPTSAALGFSCATLLGMAFSGGVVAGSNSPTSPLVQADIKAVPTLSKSSQAGTKHTNDHVGSSNPWAQDIEFIRFQCDVSVSALAGLFDVTRKTFYGWMSGEVMPRSHRIVRISALRSALSALSSREERSAVFGLLDKRASSGQNIREIIASNSEDENVLDQLTDVLREFDPQVQKGAERARKTGTKSRAHESAFPTA